MEGKEKRRKGWEVFEDELTPSAPALPPGGSPSWDLSGTCGMELRISGNPRGSAAPRVPWVTRSLKESRK